MSLRSTPGAMTKYQREYSRMRSLSADERRALVAAMEAAEKGKCRCRSCDLLRAIATVRRAARNGSFDLTQQETHG